MAARLLRLLLAVAIALPAVGAASRTPLIVGCAAAGASPHHVAVVVEHADGRVVGGCVAFDGAAITAEDALRATGLEVGVNTTGGYGDEVCQIDGEPASYDPNGCLRSGQPYWSLWVSRSGGGWAYSQLGVSSLSLADGDAEGWRYESGSGAAPPSPRGTCPATAPPRPALSKPPASATPSPVPPPAEAAPVPSPTPPAAVAQVPAAGLRSPAAGLGSPAPSAVHATPLVRQYPAAARAAGGGSWVGWALLAVLLATGGAVLAGQLRHRRRVP